MLIGACFGLLLIYCLNGNGFCQPVGIGKVFIGLTDSDATNYTFSGNYPLDNLVIPVSVQIIDPDTGSSLPLDEPVNVTCDIVEPLLGPPPHSYVMFNSSEILTINETNQGYVGFSDIMVGRGVRIQCWSDDQPSFNRNTSISPYRWLTIAPSATVSPYYTVNTLLSFCPQIWIILSEKAKTSVTINCYVVSGAPGNFTQSNVLAGHNLATVPFNADINSTPELGDTVFQCYGQSTGPDEFQFLPDTSRGSFGSISYEPGVVTLYPNSAILKATTFNGLLIINQPPMGSDVTYQCSVYDASDEIIDSTTPQCLMSTGLNVAVVIGVAFVLVVVAVVVASSTWRLSSYEYKFTSATACTSPPLFQPVSLSRMEPTSSYNTREEILVECCQISSTIDDELFNGTWTQLRVVAYLSPSLEFTGPAGDNTSSNGLTDDPTFRNFALCPCDLTPIICDINCCCDQSCSAEFLEIFAGCDPGYFGGFGGSFTPDHFCTQSSSQAPVLGGSLRRGGGRPGAPNYSPIMCTVFESSSFYGLFLSARTELINSPGEFVSVKNSVANQPSFGQDRCVFPGEDIAGCSITCHSCPLFWYSTPYTFGVSLTTAVQNLSAQLPPFLNIGPNYLLTLPQRTLSGQCVWAAPVRFLTDSYSLCVRKLQSAADCAGAGPLDPRMYVQDSASGSPGPFVLKTHSQKNVTYTIVNYLCATNASAYVKSRVVYSDLVGANDLHLFRDSDAVADGCEFDMDTGAYVCGNTADVSDVTADVAPCSAEAIFDPPQLDLDGESCNNVVVAVTYNFTWSGQSLLLLTATIVLANITYPAEFHQEIRVVYYGVSKSGGSGGGSEESAGGEDTSSRVTPFSGNPGYDKSLPVISGVCLNCSDFEADSTTIDTSDVNQLRLFKPATSSLCLCDSFSGLCDAWCCCGLFALATSGSGLCDSAGRHVILFGVDAISSCLLRLDYQTFLSCSNLRKLTLSGLDRMMPSNYISQLGNTSRNNASDWTKIYRESLFDLINGTDSRILINEVLDNLTGICLAVPSGIHVNIMYTQAGLANYQPIYTILSAMINYTVSDWSLDCSGENSEICLIDSSTKVQSFIVTSSVNFIKIPANADTRKITTYDAQSRPSYVCKDGGCLSETFYPFMKINYGMDQQYTLALALLSIIFFIFLVVITGPVSEW